MMFTLLEYTMSVHFVGDDSQLNAIKSLQFSQKCKAPMKTPRRYAPMGGGWQASGGMGGNLQRFMQAD